MTFEAAAEQFVRRLCEDHKVNWSGKKIPKTKLQLLNFVLTVSPTATVGFAWYASDADSFGVAVHVTAAPTLPAGHRQAFVESVRPVLLTWLASGVEFGFEVSPACVGAGAYEARWTDGGSRLGVFGFSAIDGEGYSVY